MGQQSPFADGRAALLDRGWLWNPFGLVGLKALRLPTLFDGTVTAGTLGFSGLARGIGAELSGNAGMIDQMSVEDTR